MFNHGRINAQCFNKCIPVSFGSPLYVDLTKSKRTELWGDSCWVLPCPRGVVLRLVPVADQEKNRGLLSACLTFPRAALCTRFCHQCLSLSLRDPALALLLHGSPFWQSIRMLHRKDCEFRGVFVRKNSEGKFLDPWGHSADRAVPFPRDACV